MQQPPIMFRLLLLLSIHFITLRASAEKQGQLLIDSLIAHAQTEKNEMIKVAVLNALSSACSINNPDTAIIIAQQALQLAEKTNLPLAKAKAHIYTANALSQMGKLPEAKLNYDIAQSICENQLVHGPLSRKYEALATLGLAYNAIGIWNLRQVKNEDAIKVLLKALKIRERLKDKKGISYTMNNLGVLYDRQSFYDQALAYYTGSLEMRKALKDTIGMANSYNNIAGIYLNNKNYPEALRYYKTSGELFDALNDPFGRATNFINLSLAQSELDINSPEIEKNYLKALQISKEIEDFENIALCLSNLGDYYHLTNQSEKAYTYLQSSLEIARQHNLTNEILLALKLLYPLDSSIQNHKMAFIHYQQYISLRDSTFNIENTKRSTELAMQYAFDKKEAATKAEQDKKDLITIEETKQQRTVRNYSFAGIAVLILFGGFTYSRYLQRKKLSNQLQLSLTELKQTQQQLIQLEKEKEAEAIRLRISRDIHDEIGSNLTKIAMLGNLTSTKTKEQLPEVALQLEQISDYARNVNNSMSEIIWAVNPKQDTLENLLSYMRVHANEFLKDSGINYTINFPDNIPAIQLHPDFKRNIFLVYKEALNNSLKYASAKKIHLSFSLAAERYELTITDNGKGFNYEEEMNKGNGISNMKERLSQSGGQLTIKAVVGWGCSITANGLIQAT
ncbi:MAG: hypothetical protein RIQ89_255 [Bacteroidota bacterium]|jgi:signal transduction histidine kinase